MWELRRTSVRPGCTGGSVAHPGSPDLRAMRREGAPSSQERPDRRRHYFDSDDPGTRCRRRVVAIPAWFPPLAPRGGCKPRIPRTLRWRSRLDEKSESSRGASSRPTRGPRVGSVEPFDSRADSRWYSDIPRRPRGRLTSASSRRARPPRDGSSLIRGCPDQETSICALWEGSAADEARAVRPLTTTFTGSWKSQWHDIQQARAFVGMLAFDHSRRPKQ